MASWKHTYDQQRRAANQHDPELLQITSDLLHVATNNIRLATEQEDRHEGCDLVVSDLIHVACRVRDYDQLRFDGQFTLRLQQNQKGLNELQKIVTGNGDFMLYGFADEAGEHLHKWYFLDLRVFRRAAADGFALIDFMLSPVKTGDCHFWPYMLDAFNSYGKLVVATSNF